jgi:hypothetical protein
VPGNEEADKLARLGAQLEQPDNQITYKEKATNLKGSYTDQTGSRCLPHVKQTRTIGDGEATLRA